MSGVPKTTETASVGGDSGRGTAGDLLNDTSNSNNAMTTTLLCELVAYLIASVVKTEEEWKQWGEPFLQRMYEAQVGDEEGTKRLQQMQSQFYPLIGHGMAVWLEDTSTITTTSVEDAEYLMISSVEERFVKVLQPYFTALSANNPLLDPSQVTTEGTNTTDKTLETSLNPEDSVFQNVLQVFLQKLIAYQASHHLYDARGRTIAKKICHLLHVSAMEMSLYEQQQQQQTQGSKASFLQDFHQTASQVPRASLVVSYKLWRVAFIAAGGGAMVGMASFAAAPTLMATIVPILTSAVNVMQVSIAMETFLSYVGMVSYSVLPTAFTTYGASVASRKMLKRYGEIKQFELLPLHISWANASSSSAPTRHLPASASSNAPIYILVSGHMEKNLDPRALWGANGTVLLLEDVEDEGQDKNDKNDLRVPEAEKEVDQPPKVRRQLSKDDLREEIEAEVHELAELMKDNMEHATEESQQDYNSGANEDAKLTKAMSDDWAELQVKHQGWWRDMIPHGEEYILLWETDVLSNLNESFIQMFKDSIYSKIYGKFQESLWKLTPIYPIKQAISLPKWALGKLKELDDAWVVAMDRAQQAGKLLAKTLLAQKLQQQQQGGQYRSINLIGYGMGARVIFHCLEQLAAEGKEAGKGIVENVVLMGAPVGTSYQAWYQARLMVANRFVNAYSRFDWLLALLYRSRSLEFGVAGLYPVHISTTAAANDLKIKTKQGWTSMFITKASIIIKEEFQNLQSKINFVGPSSSAQGEAQDEMSSKENEMGLELTLESPELPTLSAEELEEEKVRTSLHQCQDIENIDVTELVYNHSDYPMVLPTILKMISLQ